LHGGASRLPLVCRLVFSFIMSKRTSHSSYNRVKKFRYLNADKSQDPEASTYGDLNESVVDPNLEDEELFEDYCEEQSHEFDVSLCDDSEISEHSSTVHQSFAESKLEENDESPDQDSDEDSYYSNDSLPDSDSSADEEESYT